MILFWVSTLALLGRVHSQCISENDNSLAPEGSDLSPITPFGIEVLKQLLPPSGNFVFSPYSIWTALVLAYLGSEGNTKTQLEATLGINNTEETFALFKKVDQLYSLASITANYTLNAANKIYVQKDFNLKDCLQTVFSNEMQFLDFKQAKEAAVVINEFVNNTTRGLIPQIVSPDALQDAMMVLVNAVYFKGLWDVQFNTNNTIEESFFPSPEEEELVPMMNEINYFRYGESLLLDAEILEIPYADNNISMLIIIPGGDQTGTELDEMIGRLTAVHFENVTTNLEELEIHLKLPKFKFENHLDKDLQKVLHEIGITDLFSNKANLTNFSPKEALTVSKIIHQAVIEVNEEGSEAAAATVVIMPKIISMPPSFPPLDFFCNRPFLFAIRDNNLNNLLFMGVYRHK